MPSPLSTSTPSMTTAAPLPISRPPRRTLLFALLAFTLYRHRASLRNLFGTLSTLSHSVSQLSQILSLTANDLQTYLHPPPPSSPPSRSPPPSLHRLLRLASTPDALTILRHISGAIAQGITRELHHPIPSTSTHPLFPSTTPKDPFQTLVQTLASPSGQALVSNVISTAVRETITTISTTNSKPAHTPSSRPAIDLVMDKLLSDRGRRLLVDAVGAVVQSAIPAWIHVRCQEPPNTCTTDGTVTPLSSPQGSLRRKRGASFVAGESPVSRELVLSVMQSAGGGGVIERLALLAIRDKELVREVVRTVVGEAVKTYLKTSREMNGGGVREDGREGVWKVFVRSFVVDVRRALMKRGEEGGGGWLVF